MRRLLCLIAAALSLAACAPKVGGAPGVLVDTTRGVVGPVQGPDGGQIIAHEQLFTPSGPYRLDSGDRVRVVVFGQEGLTNAYALDATGAISMPLIGAVAARGRSTHELEAEIAARLRAGFLRDPSVSVEVETYRPFFIMGEVLASGQFPYVNGMTAQMAVAIAGGFTPRANRQKIEVTRKVNGQAMRANVPPTHPILPGDTIVVRERWF